MMHMKAWFLTLLLIFLGFSYVFSTISAVPTTRTQKFINQNTSVLLPFSVAQDELDHYLRNNVDGGEVVLDHVEEELMETRRMDLETNDYGTGGANNDHDPNAPGRL
ncbi:putative Transmembrane protein [Quillaja saponaria]|uniref:Transmembrane protein n=1 Tax=Quillaja saponaria TaxID=32244 RepID=A0AAD7VDW4_QUISA|nr:putative Transmembrane protein [Quillaja saponaria]